MSTPFDIPGPGRPIPTPPGTTVSAGPGAYEYGGPAPAPSHDHPADLTVAAHRPVADPRPKPPGGALTGFAALMQVGLLVAIGLSLWRFTPELGNSAVESIQRCEDAGGDLSCLTSAPVWRHALLPLAGAIAAFSLFRGAMVGNTRRPGGGMVLTLLGFAILAATMAYGLG